MNPKELNELTQAIPGVIFQFRVEADGEWKFVYLSAGLGDLYEIAPEAAYADTQTLDSCILEDDITSYRASVELAHQNLTPWIHEYRILTPGGKLKWIGGQALPSLQEDGSVHWNGILTDIAKVV